MTDTLRVAETPADDLVARAMQEIAKATDYPYQNWADGPKALVSCRSLVAVTEALTEAAARIEVLEDECNKSMIEIENLRNELAPSPIEPIAEERVS